jgi:hypothetical protein
MSLQFKATKDAWLAVFALDGSGDPVASMATADVTVYDVTDGSVLLSATAMTKRVDGLWSYEWVHGFTAERDCVAFFETTNGNGSSFFTIDTLQADIDEREAQSF